MGLYGVVVKMLVDNLAMARPLTVHLQFKLVLLPSGLKLQLERILLWLLRQTELFGLGVKINLGN